MALYRGHQLRWNRVCELVAYAVYFICISIPRFSKGQDWRSDVRSVGGMLKRFPPPGYAPDADK